MSMAYGILTDYARNPLLICPMGFVFILYYLYYQGPGMDPAWSGRGGALPAFLGAPI
jgi:hypothetical protein